MRDRVVQRFIGGVFGAIVMNINDWLIYLSGFHEERLFDWASIILLGRLASGTGELIFAQLAQLIFSGSIWFFLYGAAIGLKLPHLENRALLAGISHFISASSFGLVLAYYRNKNPILTS